MALHYLSLYKSFLISSKHLKLYNLSNRYLVKCRNLIWFYLLWLGYDYVSFGLSSHSELNLYLGVLIVLGAFFFRFFDFFGEDMVGDGGDQTVLGISLMFWGVLYIGLVIYLRERWLVTGPLEEEDAIDAGAIHYRRAFYLQSDYYMFSLKRMALIHADFCILFELK